MQTMSTKPGSRRFYGWKQSNPDARDAQYSPPPRAAAMLPDTLDLSTPALGAPFDPCWNQGQLGSCGPNTAGECLSIVGQRTEKRSNFPHPSRLFIYYWARSIMGTLNQDSGVDNRSMMKALAKYGWCDEVLCPYADDPSTFLHKPSAAAIAQAAQRLVASYQAVAQTLPTMQACLVAGNPVIYGFTVYTSFEDDAPAQTGIIPMPNLTKEEVLGGHDTTICGYSNVQAAGVMPGNIWPARTFKFRNHWYNDDGTPWGDGGYGYMPYEYATNPKLSGDFWTILATGMAGVSPTPPSPTPPSPTPTPTPTQQTKVITITGSNLSVSVN